MTTRQDVERTVDVLRYKLLGEVTLCNMDRGVVHLAPIGTKTTACGRDSHAMTWIYSGTIEDIECKRCRKAVA